MNRIAAALFASSLLGCATSSADAPEPSIRWADRDAGGPVKDVPAKGEDPNLIRVCEWEEMTGTHIRQKVCRNVAAIEDDRAAARRMMSEINRGSQQRGY